MIRVVPRTFCQGSIIIIHTCNRKNEGRLICGARSCSGGFADRSSERRYRRLHRRACYRSRVIDLLSPASLKLTRDW